MAGFGRFLDTWVVDRVMFEFVNQGGCNCCGFTHSGMGMNDFMALCSDVETDDGKKETTSPWPQFMQDEVWADRVKARRILKESMSVYRERHEQHGESFVQWWMSIEPKERKRCFQMPKEELAMQFSDKFDFKAAYRCVLCSVLEQVEKFDATGYKADGATDCEIFFEERLQLHRGAWIMDDDYFSTDLGCDMFFGMFLQLGGDHLMPKRPTDLREESARAKQAAEGGIDDLDGKGEPQDSGKQSFRSDRRLCRLIIFRYFADMAWARFKRAVLDKE